MHLKYEPSSEHVDWWRGSSGVGVLVGDWWCRHRGADTIAVIWQLPHSEDSVSVDAVASQSPTARTPNPAPLLAQGGRQDRSDLAADPLGRLRQRGGSGDPRGAQARHKRCYLHLRRSLLKNPER